MINQSIKDQLIELHNESYGWALMCCDRNKQVAIDVLQSSYLKVLEGKATFRDRASFKTWFFAVVRNTAIDMMKKEAKRNVNTTEVEMAIHLADAAKEGSTSDSKKLEKALTQLSNKQRELMHLLFYQGMTLDEASDVMNISGGTARQHYHRAKLKLKELLK